MNLNIEYILDDTKKPASHVAVVVKDPSVNAG